MNRKSSSQAGMSLVEATIVLAVVSTLAAMMAPSVNNYVEQARQVRAREDLASIADSILQFITDTGEHQFLINGNGTTQVYTPPTHIDDNRVDLLVSDGDVPVIATAIGGDLVWKTPVNNGVVDTLSNHLVQNTPGEVAAQRYRTGTDITISGGANNIDFARPGSAGLNAPHAWRGPYVRGPVDPDPWGNRYAVNVIFLDPVTTNTPLTTFTGNGTPSAFARYDVFVLSAGADEEVDTPFAQDGAVPGDDDFIYLVSANAK